MNNMPLPSPSIMNIQPYVGGKSKVNGLERVIKLSSNENPYGASPEAIKAATDSLNKIHRYPDSTYYDLRTAIGEIYNLDPQRIVCGAGSDELIGMLVHAYAGVGSEVLYSEHGFLMYKIYALSNGAIPVTAPEKNYKNDMDALLAKVTERTRILFLANPNNPTGSYITNDELYYLHSKLPSHIILAVDGAYSEYVEAEDYSDGLKLVDEASNVVVLRTFSKVYGLPSLRLGWGYYPAEIADVMNRVRGPFNVSSIAANAGVAAVKDQSFVSQSVEKNNTQKKILAQAINGMGFHVYPSECNFIMVEFGKNYKQANEFLMSRGLIVREIYNYGLAGKLRISIGTEEENKILIVALNEFKDAQ